MSRNKTIRPFRKRLGHRLLKTPPNLLALHPLLEDAATRGILDRQAIRMIKGVLQVSVLQVHDVMVPRAQMISITDNATITEALPIITQTAHSRFPVMSADKSHISGILLAKDLLPYLLENANEKKISEFIRPASFIPETKRIDILLEEFRNNRNHMAIVVDEFGSPSGIITIEDVLEEIVGEIEDEYDSLPTTYIKKKSNSQYEVSPQTPLKDINQYFNTHLKHDQADTIGGVIHKKLSRLAKRGDQLSLDGLKIKVTHITARGIKSLQITPKKSPRK